jgi:serine protease Do
VGVAEEFEEAAERVRELALAAVVGVGSVGPAGSGIVFAEGVVVTSAHNVHSERPGVHFGEGSRRAADRVAVDLAGDLAVLTVPTKGTAAVRWAGQEPQLGTPIFAAANPGGRGSRLSFGVVSAQNREFRGPGGRPISGGFEHTAQLPHGSSGGPVLNFGGELLGINTKRLGEGLYAAITADAGLRARIEALARGEAVARAYLGVGLLPSEVAHRLRAAVGLPERNGVLVQHLDEEGPAAKAGLLRGDLLTSAGGSAILQAADLHRVLAGVRPGDQLGLELVRGTEELHLSVTLGTEPEGPERPNRWQHFGGRS